MTAEKKDDAWWISTKEFLPDPDEKVLVISKWGDVATQIYSDFGLDGRMLFRPDGLKPVEDIKLWMPIPTDGWHDIKSDKPKPGDIVLNMGMYGSIFGGIWAKPAGTTEYRVMPFPGWGTLFWREMPTLPDEVQQKLRCTVMEIGGRW